MKAEASDLIQRPRTMRFNWFGTAGREPKAGDYMRAIPSERTWLVLSARRVKVRVSRGETLRQALELLPWPDEIPGGAKVYRFHWDRRPRRRARRLKP